MMIVIFTFYCLRFWLEKIHHFKNSFQIIIYNYYNHNFVVVFFNNNNNNNNNNNKN
jgi:hypothetical protein